MWVRKKIDLSTAEILKAIVQISRNDSREQLYRKIESKMDSDQLLVALSVRSGFDAFLQAVDWEPGSEVLLTGFTIPDMAEIVIENGYRPVGMDVDSETLAPEIDEWQSRISSRTRAMVVAHLWGGRMDLEPVAAFAKTHNLVLIEDCAQAFDGNATLCHPDADVAMYSFGSIKTNTALGGAILHVKDRSLLLEMRQIQREWPSQSRSKYLMRLFKYLGIKGLSHPVIASVVTRAISWVNGDHDSVVSQMAKGFAGPDFFRRIRKQPSTPLLTLLLQRLCSFSIESLNRRRQMGLYLEQKLAGIVPIVGTRGIRPTYWVFAILVEDPMPLIRRLWKAGFDATNRSSLNAFDTEKNGVKAVCDFRKRMVFLPLDPSMPISELDRMSAIICGHFESLDVCAVDDESHLADDDSTPWLTNEVVT